jgi:hypothetical protein
MLSYFCVFPHFAFFLLFLGFIIFADFFRLSLIFPLFFGGFTPDFHDLLFLMTGSRHYKKELLI